MPRWILIIVVACLSLSMNVQGQEYLLKHYTMEDGLPSNTIYTVYRDSKGFLWITTDRGVARYNGIKFEKFTTFDGLADNEVFYCREDRQGRIWFACFNGELCYFKDDTFHNPRNTPSLRQQYKYAYVRFITEQEDGSLIFTFYNGNYFCYLDKQGCHSVVLDTSLFPGNFIVSVKKKGSDRYRLIRVSNAYVLETKPSVRVVCYDKLEGKPRFVNFFGCQGQGYYFNDTALYDDELNQIYRLPDSVLKNTLLHQVYGNADYWFFGTPRGLYIESKSGGAGAHIFREKGVSTITQDTHHNYWAGTLDDGIYCFSESFAASAVYPAVYKNKIWYAREVKGELFFCTSDKNVYLLKDGQPKLLFHQAETDPVYPSATFFVDGNLSCYFLSQTAAVKIDNLLSTPLKIARFATRILYGHSLKKVIKVDDRLYVTTGANVVIGNYKGLKTGDSIHYRLALPNMGERVFAMAKSNENAVWFSTLDQLYKIENEKGVPQRQFKNMPFKNFTFCGSSLVGYTQYNQLLVCNNVNGRVTADTVLQDCVWESLYGLDSDHVLIGTNGLYYLLTVNAGKPPDISAIESPFVPQQAEAVCVGAHDCYFFKKGAIIKVDKGELMKKATAPTLYFTNLRTIKRMYPIRSAVELPFSGAGNIAISFSAVSFGGKDITYQYSISRSGQDRWINFKGDINLANQAFGDYTVKVRAKTMSSAYSEPIAFTLVILRPFWATWWFIAFSVCAVIVIIYLLVKRRIQLTLKKKGEEHDNKVRFIKSEYKAMNALMNPHFIFNTLNNVQSLVNNDDKLNAIEYLAIFADLIRQNMHNISNDTIPLLKEIELVENYLLLEKLRFEDQLNYAVNVSDNVYVTDIMVPPLLIQPLVENSIKHGILPLKSRGIKGIVQVNIYEQKEILYIEVRDNGIGIAKAKERKSLHKSYGLDNLRSRIDQLSIIQGKDISFSLSDVTNDEGVLQWTVATISLPL